MSDGEAISRARSEQLVELAKRRGFFFPSNSAYGGIAGFYTFGPEGARLKRNVESAWRERYSVKEGHPEIDAPTVMPEPVFEASGHLDTFDDLLITCPGCDTSHRADHVIEDATAIDDAEALPIPEVESVIAEYEITCPRCGQQLAGEAVESFNLMFETTIGPGHGVTGYLRPETAQGIFVEFPRLKEYARGKLPFGVTQIGRAYRNEISPRRSILRVRELTQAELELFVDPTGDGPDLGALLDRTLPLYSIDDQREEAGSLTEVTLEEALENGVIASAWIGYYLAIAHEWFGDVGVDRDRLRFRQHLPDERSHYASDCWDAEVELDGNWIELAGFAYRGDYDLLKHDQYADDDFTVFQPFDEPKTVERARVDPDMSVLGPEFGAKASTIVAELERRVAADPSAFDGDTITLDIDGEEITLSSETAGYSKETVTQNGEHVHPHVVEPSFGIDRLVYTVLDHSYREDEIDGQSRVVLELPPAIAPTTVAVLPLMDRDGLTTMAQIIAEQLREAGLAVSFDDSGNIGRRYRRQDEVGTPFCVTVDYETLEDETVTVRDRDTTHQIRVSIDDLGEELERLIAGEDTIEPDDNG